MSVSAWASAYPSICGTMQNSGNSDRFTKNRSWRLICWKTRNIGCNYWHLWNWMYWWPWQRQRDLRKWGLSMRSRYLIQQCWLRRKTDHGKWWRWMRCMCCGWLRTRRSCWWWIYSKMSLASTQQQKKHSIHTGGEKYKSLHSDITAGRQ